jgi:hypothetical protein
MRQESDPASNKIPSELSKRELTKPRGEKFTVIVNMVKPTASQNPEASFIKAKLAPINFRA